VKRAFTEAEQHRSASRASSRIGANGGLPIECIITVYISRELVSKANSLSQIE
jgi:hypothetical protein